VGEPGFPADANEQGGETTGGDAAKGGAARDRMGRLVGVE
jgi:hypothetical protein